MTSDVPQSSNPDLTPDTPQENTFIEEIEGLEPLNIPDIEGENPLLDPSDQLLYLTEESSKSVDLENTIEELTQEVEILKQQKQGLIAEIESLEVTKAQKISEKTQTVEETLEKMIVEGLKELQQKKQTLELSVEQLERRRDRIREEMKTNFAGISQDLAIRVQGFKDYLVGSLQDLAAAAEQLDLPSQQSWEQPSEPVNSPSVSGSNAQFAPQEFAEQTRKIQQILEQYRKNPDYYGPPWQLRRTFEPIHTERVQKWFFSQGGRGTVKSMGSRLQNILVASAVISILNELHGDRTRFLILANTPERLGEWRRGLQDCLGISRGDFGPERGVVLFESPNALVQKAERLVEEDFLPLVIIDEAEEQISLSLLQFPLWLAFAPDPEQMSSYLY
ncbi:MULTISPECIES: DUF3086 domain-containing protein [Crocosphaera]|uniref:Uncharacterized protein n=1 Tax=Crocosphaera watsonii WH 0003 TaxID=423471 RepID=G5J3H5_CROWT|nr:MULTISPECIES: DUF3086 domain-containing protein [Crocosphaera]EHJ13266.1 hypothetical protein CWATWH0003_2051 [Crocosphaera watsonii WH 0003]MCH2247202.1 DUF3086 domain-containing protein [Crocosphaera sp.]